MRPYVGGVEGRRDGPYLDGGGVSNQVRRDAPPPSEQGATVLARVATVVTPVRAPLEATVPSPPQRKASMARRPGSRAVMGLGLPQLWIVL